MKNSLPNIIVTGAGSGIGKEVALLLGQSNKVICTSKSKNCEDTVKEIGENGSALICDFTDIISSELILTNFIDNFDDEIDCVIHCAGFIGESGPLENTNLSNWLKTFNINFFSSVLIAKLLIPKFKKQGYGKFIFFGGGGSAYGYPVLPQYSTSKTSLVRFVENLELEIKDENIETIILAPGAVDTSMLRDVLKKEKKYGSSSKVRSNSDIKEVVSFIKYMYENSFKSISGKLVHINDDWKEFIKNNDPYKPDLWTLRRIEE